MLNTTALPQAVCPRCTINFLRGIHSHLTTDFRRAFDDNHRGARKLTKSGLRAHSPVSSAARGTASRLFSTWVVEEATLTLRAMAWQVAISGVECEFKHLGGIHTAKVPRCEKRNLQYSGRLPKIPKVTPQSEISMKMALLNAGGAIKSSIDENLPRRQIRLTNLIK